MQALFYQSKPNKSMIPFFKPKPKKNNDSDETMPPKKVLMVDDEPGGIRLAKINLEAAGNYEVMTISVSQTAVDAAKKFQPDIILLDVVMPGMDGGDVARELRSHPETRDIPIIFVSAMVSKKESDLGFYESGGEYFLSKPVQTATLCKSIDTLLK